MACGDTAEMFDAKKETFDKVAMFVLMLVVRTLVDPVGARRDNGGSTQLLNVRNQGIGIVSLVSDYCIRMQSFEQGNGLLSCVWPAVSVHRAISPNPSTSA